MAARLVQPSAPIEGHTIEQEKSTREKDNAATPRAMLPLEPLATTIDNLIPPLKTNLAERIARQASITHGNLAHLAKLLALEPIELTESLEQLKITRGWSDSTLIARCNTLMAMCSHVAMSKRDALRAAILALRRKTSAVQLPAWNPLDENQCMSARQAATLWEMREKAPGLILPLVISFVAGQRNGDVLLWRTAMVNKLAIGNAPQHVMVTVVEGKTVPTTGPYTIHFPVNSPIADEIWKIKMKNEELELPYIFLGATNLLTHADARARVLTMQANMKAFYQGDLRSPRRGGLSALALMDVPETQLLTLSRHPGADMLRRYLAAGKLNNCEAQLQAEAIGINEKSLQGISQGISQEL